MVHPATDLEPLAEAIMANSSTKVEKVTPPPRKAISMAQLRPFLEIAIPFFKEDRNAFFSLLWIVVLTLVESAMVIGFSFVRRDIFDALHDLDEPMFYRKIILFFGVLVIIVPVTVLYNYQRLKLALYWRKELTARVLDKYYANRTYYIIECCKDIDNPDQRICEDLTEFTGTSLDFFFIVFDATINLLSFSAVLFQIYPLLFAAIIVYAIFGTFISAHLGRALVGQYYDKLQSEADFRFGLIRTRENAEGIAFYDSNASMEQINLWTLFEKAIETQLGIIRTQRSLEMFTTSYDYLVYVIPYLVVAPLYFSGKLNLGSITQSSEAFYYVRSDFSIIVNYFEKISAFSAGIDRLSTFIHRINEGGWQVEHTTDLTGPPIDEHKPRGTLTDLTRSLAGSPGGYLKVSAVDEADSSSGKGGRRKRSTIDLIIGPLKPYIDGNQIKVKDDDVKIPVLRCESLTVLTPDGYRILIGGVWGSHSGLLMKNTESCSEQCGVNFTIFEGDRVLVVGPSGAGKSSLLRAISGLWELGSGKVTWNSGLRQNSVLAAGDGRDSAAEAPEGVFFLPQKPYNLLGSLRQQIAYPDVSQGDEEESSVRQKHRGSKQPETPTTATQARDGDSELLEILRKVRLDTLASRMGGGDERKGLALHKDWSKVLSLGEQQRLAFARVLYNRRNITVAVLDEATSALDEVNEAAMYSLLGELGITYISVGHRTSLYNYHTTKLTLQGPGCDVDCTSINQAMEHR